MVSPLISSGEVADLLAQARVFLAARRIEGYLVGGFVRDGLLGCPSRDLDLAVAGDARDLAQGLARVLDGRYVLLDETHQVVARVVVSSGFQLDLATMRGTIAQDLAQRDFTVDALAISLTDLELTTPTIIDPFEGQRDLAARTIRALGEDCLVGDPLRLLRGVRLAAELDFSLEEQTRLWMKQHGPRLGRVAPERITAELSMLLSLVGAAPWLRTLDELGFLDIIIPELAVTRGAAQPQEHHWDVLQHSLATVAAVEALLGGPVPGWLPQQALSRQLGLTHWAEIQQHLQEEVAGGRPRIVILKLAALLHDVAKPQTKTVEPSGRVRFFGHPKEGAEIAAAILERLRFSTKEVRQVAAMVENHLRPGQLGDDRPTLRAVHRYFRDLEEAALDTLVLGLADHLATRGPSLDLAAWQEHLAQVDYLLSCYFGAPEVVRPSKLVDGHRIMERFGLGPGPLIGQLLTRVREAQAQGEVRSQEEALALIAKELSWKP